MVIQAASCYIPYWMYGSRFLAGTAIGFALLMCGCSKPAPVAAQAQAAEPDPIPHARELDDTARFVAVIPGNPGSPFAELEASAAWKDHRQRVDTAWNKA